MQQYCSKCHLTIQVDKTYDVRHSTYNPKTDKWTDCNGLNQWASQKRRRRRKPK